MITMMRYEWEDGTDDEEDDDHCCWWTDEEGELRSRRPRQNGEWMGKDEEKGEEEGLFTGLLASEQT